MTEPDPCTALAQAINDNPRGVAVALYRTLSDVEGERERFRVALKQLAQDWESAEWDGRHRGWLQCSNELKKILSEHET